ncbi:hypothetical protein RSAG8_05967, partial [Rhizoctonia solani AG-8 WAC10335]
MSAFGLFSCHFCDLHGYACLTSDVPITARFLFSSFTLPYLSRAIESPWCHKYPY